MATEKPNELRITRIYDAPVSAVWEAWVDPKQVAKWWGPRGFTITTHSKDLKVGGHWRYTMHGPDGTDYPNHTIYHEVREQKLLVYDHGGYEDRPPLFRVTVKFDDLGDQTRMEMIMACPSPEAAEETKKFIKNAQGNSTWDRLGEYLEKKLQDRDVFVINRNFEAPRQTVFEYWTDPSKFSGWLGPAGATMEIIEGEVQEGESLFFKMTFPPVPGYFARASYLAINEPDYLEYTQSFADESGKLTKHPFVQNWPDYFNTKVFFAEEGPNQCRVTVIWEPHGKFSADEMNTFVRMKGDCTTGWNQSFDSLEKLLAQ